MKTSFLASVLILVNAGIAQSSPAHSAIPELTLIAGAYDCTPASGAAALGKIILFADGNWLQRDFFDTMPHKTFWIEGHQRWGDFRIPNVQVPHGIFQVHRDTVLLYTTEAGYPGLGKPSRFDKKVPDMDLVLTKRFRIMPASGEWIEVMPLTSSRPPMKCKASATI